MSLYWESQNSHWSTIDLPTFVLKIIGLIVEWKEQTSSRVKISFLNLVVKNNTIVLWIIFIRIIGRPKTQRSLFYFLLSCYPHSNQNWFCFVSCFHVIQIQIKTGFCRLKKLSEWNIDGLAPDEFQYYSSYSRFMKCLYLFLFISIVVKAIIFSF